MSERDGGAAESIESALREARVLLRAEREGGDDGK